MCYKSLVYYYFVILLFPADSQGLSQQAFQADSNEISLNPIMLPLHYTLVSFRILAGNKWHAQKGLMEKNFSEGTIHKGEGRVIVGNHCM